MTLDINVLLVAIFLLISFAVGIAAGKGINTFRKFSTGDKNFKTSTLVATLVATGFGGGFLFYDLELIYTEGWYYGLANLLGPVGAYFIVAYWMAPRMGEFIQIVGSVICVDISLKYFQYVDSYCNVHNRSHL